MSAPALPLSVVMITQDAAAHLERVLSALAWADDVVIVDSGSRDDTVAIATAHGARVIAQPFLGFGPQKRLAVSLAVHDWVLNIDADEVLDDEAQAAIRQLPWANLDPHACFAIRRRNFIGSREIRYGAWNPDWCLRLFNRTTTNFDSAAVHERVRSQRPAQRLGGSILHYSFPDLAHIFKLHYARIKADGYVSRGRRANGFVLCMRLCWAFCASLLLKRGFLDGGPGVMVAASHALNHSLGLALASAIARGECPPSTPPADQEPTPS